MTEKYILLQGQDVLNGVNELRELVKSGIQRTDSTIGEICLSQLHKKLSISSVNSIRLGAFKFLNSLHKNLDLIFEQIAGESLKSILGPDLLIQTKVNLSIQLPGDVNSQLDLHSDCWSGDTPFQLNLWIPLTPCFASNSMFLLSEKKTLTCLDLINHNPTIDRNVLWSYVEDEDFLALPKGQAIIFNPGLLHGNIPNMTDQSRVSINVRFKNVFSPDASSEHISRSAGPYYRKFQISDWTRLALKLHRINHHKHDQKM